MCLRNPLTTETGGLGISGNSMTGMNILPSLKLYSTLHHLKHIQMEKYQLKMNFFTKSTGWNVSHSSIYCRNTKWESLTQRPLFRLFTEPIQCTQRYSGLGMIVWFYYGFIFCPLFFLAYFSVVWVILHSHHAFASSMQCGCLSLYLLFK